jgi:hypothetical protein
MHAYAMGVSGSFILLAGLSSPKNENHFRVELYQYLSSLFSRICRGAQGCAQVVRKLQRNTSASDTTDGIGVGDKYYWTACRERETFRKPSEESLQCYSNRRYVHTYVQILEDSTHRSRCW